VELTQLKKNWEELGQKDPMWAILSDPTKKNGKWNSADFFNTGKTDIENLLVEVKAAGISLHTGTALDFGCGIGRLTQALCSYFEKCYGVDISSSMIAEANRHNQFGDACEYVLNGNADLHCFADSSFDFVYSHLVLQHIPPEAGICYVRDFVRALKPGGLLIFQAPSEMRPIVSAPTQSTLPSPPPVAPTVSPAPPTHNMENLIDMHALPRQQVVATLENAGGKVLRVQEYNSAGPEWLSFRYWVTRPGTISRQ
jgi:SAM-dependent methyltransferase